MKELTRSWDLDRLSEIVDEGSWAHDQYGQIEDIDNIGHEPTIPALGRPALLYDRMPTLIVRPSGFHDPWPKI